MVNKCAAYACCKTEVQSDAKATFSCVSTEWRRQIRCQQIYTVSTKKL